MSQTERALSIDCVSHRFGDKVAVDSLSMQIEPAQIFGMLGPNGSGKSTLFRLIATLVPVQQGTIRVFGDCVMQATDAVRRNLGVVFQSPSLDRKLTVQENIACQAALYGIHGRLRNTRIDHVVGLLGLKDRLNDRCEKLSGGLKRRVELAKGLLHQPRLLVLDEPSTGLDPSSRIDLWQALVRLKDETGATVLLTTHLLDEADKCDRIAILSGGKLVALDSPERLRAETGETVISVSSNEPELAATVLRERFAWQPQVFDNQIRMMVRDSRPDIASEVLNAVGPSALSVTIGRPSLEDVFIKKTGHQFHAS